MKFDVDYENCIVLIEGEYNEQLSNTLRTYGLMAYSVHSMAYIIYGIPELFFAGRARKIKQEVDKYNNNE